MVGSVRMRRTSRSRAYRGNALVGLALVFVLLDVGNLSKA